jgi:hypothetical protein
MHIFLDESGDLGFDFENKQPSAKFVITLLVCHERQAAEGFRVAVRRTLKNKVNHKKGSARRIHELKGADTALGVKDYFFRHAPDDGWRLYAVALNKPRVYEYLTTAQGKKKLYNYLARFLLEKVDLSHAAPAVTLVVDKSKNKDEIRDFNQYVANQLEALLPLNVPLNIYHERSQDSAGLQAVDLFCWGVYRKYERKDLEWYSRFEPQIAFETEYLGQK